MKKQIGIISVILAAICLSAATKYPDVSIFERAVSFLSTVSVDIISEYTSTSGVTIDGTTIKDGGVITSSAGVVDLTTSDAGKLSLKANCVTDDTDSGASTHVLTAVIPAKARCLAVTCRVNTILAGTSLTTWSLGDGTDPDLYGTTLALAAGTTVGSANYTANPLTQAWSASAGDLTMTAAAGQFDSGNVTCCCNYYDATAPAS